MAMTDRDLEQSRPRRPHDGSRRDGSRRSVPEPGRGPAPGPGAGSQQQLLLQLQRLAGNKAATSLVQSARRGEEGSLPVQRHPGPEGHTHPDPFKKKKHGLLHRAWMAVARPIRTTFSPDPEMRQTTKNPTVTEDERREMTRIMDEAVAYRDQRKKQLMEESFLPEEAAEQKANEDAFSDLPESYRPRNITPAERQRIKNQKAFTDEGVNKQQAGQLKDELKKEGASKEDTKKQRETDFKFSLGSMSPEDVVKSKTEHKEKKELRTQAKTSYKEQWAKQDELEEKRFEASLSSLPKDQRESAKRLHQAMVTKRSQQRKLTLYLEEIKDYPEEERKRKVELFKKKNGIPESVGDDNADLAGSGLSMGSKLTGAGSSLASVSSDLTKSSSIGGTSVTENGVKFTSGGTADQGSAILGAGSDLTAFGNEVTTLVSAFKTKKDGNPAQQAVADDQIIANVSNIGQTTLSLGKDAIYLVESFGSTAQGVAAAGVMPIVDMGANILRLIQDAMKVTENAKRAHEQGKLKDFSEKHGQDVMNLGLQLSYGRGVHLAAHYSVDAVATGLQIAGDIVTLTGVGAAPGQAVKIAGTVIKGANTVARTVADSYLAGKTLESRRGAQLAKPGSSEELIRHDPKHASQAFISRAREGDLLAMKTLGTFGITKEILDKSDDASLRQLILAKLELSEDPTTLLGTIGGGIMKVVGKVKGFFSGMRDVHLKQFEIEDLRKAKNELGYGGTNERGAGWKMKQHFNSYEDLAGQKSRLSKAIKASGLPEDRKKELLKLTMTTREKEEQAKRDKDAKELSQRQISGPTDAKGGLKQPLESMSQSQLEEILTSPLSESSDTMLALNIWSDREFSSVSEDA